MCLSPFFRAKLGPRAGAVGNMAEIGWHRARVAMPRPQAPHGRPSSIRNARKPDASMRQSAPAP